MDSQNHHKLGDCQNKPLPQMSHLLLAPSGRDVFNPAISPSFDLPSSFLSIETIVSFHGVPTPSTRFEYTTLALFVEHPTSHYYIRCTCSIGRIKRIARQYLRPILSFLYTKHLVTSSIDPSLPQIDNSTLDVLIRLIPPSDRTFCPWHPHSTRPSLR
jgi:hypothetical protein